MVTLEVIWRSKGNVKSRRILVKVMIGFIPAPAVSTAEINNGCRVAVSESRDYVHKVVLNGQVKDNCRWYLN
jgi:hypothetical protein